VNSSCKQVCVKERTASFVCLMEINNQIWRINTPTRLVILEAH